jgi:DNA-binding GntR family transcriptional regulator
MTVGQPPLKPPHRPVPLAEQAYEWIKRRSLSGAWAPGERVTEAEFAKQLSMSRTPVREALHRLSLAGVVEPAQGGGYVRRRMSRRDLREHCVLRLLLEPEAAALAAKSDRPELEPVLAHGLDPGQLDAERNLEFHATIAEMAESEVLAKLIRMLNERAELHAVYEGDNAARRRLADQHRRIANALLAHDSIASAREMTAHLQTVRDLLLAPATSAQYRSSAR